MEFSCSPSPDGPELSHWEQVLYDEIAAVGSPCPECGTMGRLVDARVFDGCEVDCLCPECGADYTVYLHERMGV